MTITDKYEFTQKYIAKKYREAVKEISTVDGGGYKIYLHNGFVSTTTGARWIQGRTIADLRKQMKTIVSEEASETTTTATVANAKRPRNVSESIESNLIRKANEFLIEHYGLQLEIPFRISSRMKSTFGHVRFKRKGGKLIPFEMKLSKNLLENYSEDVILDVLYHECVHYALCMLGFPFRDADDCFKREVDRLGVSRTRTYRYKGKAYRYECKGCGVSFVKKTKGYEKRYMCAKCKGRFVNKGTVTI